MKPWEKYQESGPWSKYKDEISPEASAMAAKGTGLGETLTIAAGRGADKIMSGAEQFAHWVRTLPTPNWQPGTTPEKKEISHQRLGELKTEQDVKDSAYVGLQKERPYSTAGGEFLPYVAVPGGLFASSATVAGLEGLKYGEPKERAGRAAVGFGSNLVGGVAGNTVGKLIAPTRPGALTGTQREALNTMDHVGVTPRISEVTGSQFLGRVEDWAARTPGGAGVMRDFAQTNQRAVNQAAAKSIGTNADELTPAVFAETSHRLGQVFEQIKGLGGRPIQINSKVGSAADEVLRQQSKMLPTQQDANLIQIANQAKVWANGKGKIDGETYQLIRSGLSEASYDATGSNRVLYGKLLEALDSSADASLRSVGHAKLADSLKTVRQQYANLKTLEKGAVAEAGNVSPARVASALRTNNPASFREGRMAGTPLDDIARIGEAFKPLQQGSQTYERTLLSNPISTALAAGPAYLAARGATSPAMQFYPRHIGGTRAASLLADSADPALRAGMSGLLQAPGYSFLLPIMSE